MTALHRVRAIWTGFPGAPGVSTFYTLETTGFVADLQAMFFGMRHQIPNDVTIQVENSGDIIEDTTGDLTGGWVTDAVAAVDCDDSNAYAAPAGVVLEWLTDSILDHHRLRGKTYIVPAGSAMYDADGSLAPTYLGEWGDLAAAFANAQYGSFVVWHRPRDAKAADGSRPAVTARTGGHGLVTASHIPDKSCVLRSRRD